MRVRIKGKGERGAILNEDGDITRTRKSIVEAAKNLRQCMTPAEKLLWRRLRGKKLHGLKFYRQVPIGRYIVDFYCPEKKLIVEVDGSIHEEKDILERDQDREEFFRCQGLRVLTIKNEEVFCALDSACEKIYTHCAARLT
ncbi:MAG: endonuclease domain-containing protein [Candidatus Marinimicrobia bacterium]|nr:endonuclease domain-containing protein [Candidatus Neomarinimicrobiota bacterium]